MNTQKQIFLIVVLFFTLVGGCAGYAVFDLPYRAGNREDYHHEESVTRGALLFANNCRTCHGNTGEGGIGPVLNKDDFKSQEPLALKANRDLLRRTLQCGRAGTLMPAWLNTNGGALNAIQIEHLIDFITEPIDPDTLDEEGNPTSKGWAEALEYAHNLNAETTVIVGGDTLDTIAHQHGIGPKELAAANNLPLGEFLPKNTKVKIPATKQYPDGWTYTVYNKNETIEKIAGSQHYGAMLVADLNNLDYEVDRDRGSFTLLNAQGTAIPGIFPGDVLALPAGATYIVHAGDTIASVAEQHGLSNAGLVSDNRDILGSLQPEDEIPYEFALELPDSAQVIARAGNTPASIAASFSLESADAFLQENSLPADAKLNPGTRYDLPSGAAYKPAEGESVATIVGKVIDGVSAEQIASTNNVAVDQVLGTDVVLKLAKIDRYTAAGQSLEDVAATLSNVDAVDFAESNPGISTGEEVVRIGQVLHLPSGAWGTAPPDARNPGTACVQHAVTTNAFNQITGASTATPAAEPTAPATAAKDVLIELNANDFTVTADGQKQAANKGVVAVTGGTVVKFKNVEGLHTITLNGTKNGADSKGTEERTITFNKPPDKVKITCDYHPDMLAYVFVQ